MTDPLTPADCDLRDFPYLPIDIVRLFGSEFHALASDSAWRAGVTLWLKSWHQVPAGSLPDDDAQLTRLAELGRDVKGFQKLRGEALRGWQKCSDGRLYHRVVAEKALNAWLDKLAQRLASGTGNAKRWKTDFDASEIEAQIDVAVGMLRDIDPASRRIAKTIRKRSQRDANGSPGGSPTGIPAGLPLGSQGEGEERGSNTIANAIGGEPPPKPDLPPIAVSADAHLWEAGKRFLGSRGVAKGTAGSLIGKWKGAHGTAATIEALGVAQVEPNLVDPIPFIEAVLRRRSGGGGGYSIDGTPMNSPC